MTEMGRDEIDRAIRGLGTPSREAVDWFRCAHLRREVAGVVRDMADRIERGQVAALQLGGRVSSYVPSEEQISVFTSEGASVEEVLLAAKGDEYVGDVMLDLRGLRGLKG